MKSRALLLVLCCLVLSVYTATNANCADTRAHKEADTQVEKETEAQVEKETDTQAEKEMDPMVLIPAGEFRMGSETGENDEKPVHVVYLDAYHIDPYLVTNADFKKFVDANPQWGKDSNPEKYHDGDYLALWEGNDYPEDKANHPIVYVSWYAAMAYAEWAGKRLPTEAEWEKAARGRLIDRKYPWGDTEDITKAGTQMWQTPPRTTSVGEYPPNAYGLYDMTGNVWQWCLDGYAEDFYANTTERNPLASTTDMKALVSDYTSVETPRVLRGGAWAEDPRLPRVADRDKVAPIRVLSLAGFRCVQDVQDTTPEETPEEIKN